MGSFVSELLHLTYVFKVPVSCSIYHYLIFMAEYCSIYRYITICLSIHQVTVIQVASTFGYYEKCCMNILCVSFCLNMFSFLFAYAKKKCVYNLNH